MLHDDNSRDDSVKLRERIKEKERWESGKS